MLSLMSQSGIMSYGNLFSLICILRPEAVFGVFALIENGMKVLAILFCFIILCVLASSGMATVQWSDVITNDPANYPNAIGNFTAMLIPSNLYNQIPLWLAVIQSYMFTVAYLCLLSLILYLFKFMHHHMLGLSVVVAVTAGGVITCPFDTKLNWCFPMANTLVWHHYTEILRKLNFPFGAQ